MTPTRVPNQLAALRARRRRIDPEAGQATGEVVMYGVVICSIFLLAVAAFALLFR